MKTRLSININKVALIRNARGDNYPDIIQFAKDCEAYGAEGITVHPRPDERHIRFSDLAPLKEIVKTEFNVEGYPSRRFLDEVIKVKPHQCTLVPDKPEVLTSSEGWNTVENQDFLIDVINELHESNIRVSLFMDPIEAHVEGAKHVNADRIEFYTGRYAKTFVKGVQNAELEAQIINARLANSLGLKINAGHDLNLINLKHYAQSIPNLAEVSIGHALITDSLYYGISNTIGMYLQLLKI